MLYTGFVMNNKPNDPEELFHPKKYCLSTDMRVNGWLFFAICAGAANAFLFHSRLPLQETYLAWPVWLRAVIELVPLLAALLWIRHMAGWMRGMDELQRRTTLEAWLFGAAATLGVLSLWPLLDGAGVSAAVLKATKFHLEALDKPNFPLTLCLLCVFYVLGHFILNRRYK
jgi:hypothetical protein